jgi:GGDEF domain-containing protein
MLAVEEPGEAGRIFRRFAAAVRTAAGDRAVVAFEGETRAWIIGRGVVRAGAEALASQIGAEAEAVTWRGAPVGVSVGVAVVGEDGLDAAALVDAAERERFAAQASGITVTRSDR